jgi:hypothetical protein
VFLYARPRRTHASPILPRTSLSRARAHVPPPQVDYRAWLKKRAEYPDSIFNLSTELKSLYSAAHLVVESEAVRFLHHEKVDANFPLGATGVLGLAAVAQALRA